MVVAPGERFVRDGDTVYVPIRFNTRSARPWGLLAVEFQGWKVTDPWSG
ncbi:hypothetical protein DFR70_101509 [Nocardia tenerifensis]|uniref:Uncharacterized protein n=1 Tax=Nocardia tenerifensis TaxID=228006 RepID=A0A318K9U1_9NOCA|nr:hypothetical protein DFR70_101509 [Nocardia tenerifensis]